MSPRPCSIISVILADDDADDRTIFQDVLKEEAPHIKLNIVSDGFALMSLLSSYMPDLLFLDLEMPFKNGLQCLKEIRDNPALQQLPIVVFSSTNRPHNIATAYEMGAHLVFRKPDTYIQVKEALKAILLLDWSNPQQIKNQHYIDNSFQPFTL